MEQPLRIVRRGNVIGGKELPLGQAAALANHRTEAIKPVAFETDRNRPGRDRGTGSKPRKFRPAHDRTQGLGRQHFESIRLHRLDGRALTLQHIGNEIAQRPHWPTSRRLKILTE